MFQNQSQLQNGLAVADSALELLPNSPNPFIEMTLLWFRLPASANVILRIFDNKGKEIKTKTGAFEQGENHLVLQRNDLEEPGIYTYRLESEFGEATRKLVMY